MARPRDLCRLFVLPWVCLSLGRFAFPVTTRARRTYRFTYRRHILIGKKDGKLPLGRTRRYLRPLE